MAKVRTLLHGWFPIVFLLGLILLAACSGASYGKTLYHCPMHPQVTSDKPGDCPICGMKLVPVEKPGGEGSPSQKGAEKTGAALYFCPMHPEVTSDKPADCSICGMHLVKREEDSAPEPSPAPGIKKTMYRSSMNPDEVSDRPGKDSMGMEMVPFEVETPAAAGVSGLAPVKISESHRRHMNLATSEVTMRRISKEVRTSAKILPDESRLYRVTAKVEGYIEKLFVNVTGQQVKRGQPLLSIYSPELLASQQEFLSALTASKRLGASPYPEISKGGQDLVEAARRRLKLWDVSDAQIESLERSGTAEKFVTLYSPASGFVSEKSVLPGQKIMPGEPLLVVADLSRVWADADIYESDLRFVKVGMPVKLTLSSWPGREFPGRVSFLNPFLDPMARTMKARLDIPNGELLLKPEMYGDMTLSYDLGEKLAAPESAILRTGQKSVAFIDSGDSGLVPAEVVVGERGGGYYEVLSGLKKGDRVVTSANFLVDSESSLKAALQAVKN